MRRGRRGRLKLEGMREGIVDRSEEVEAEVEVEMEVGEGTEAAGEEEEVGETTKGEDIDQSLKRPKISFILR